MKKLLCLVIIIVLFAGCTPKDKKEDSLSDKPITVIDTDNLIYNYNQDGTALLALDKDNINSILETDKKMENTTKEELWIKVSNLFSKNFVVTNGYFPRGENGNFLVDVANGKIDLTNYQLNGDLNHDSMIDEKDVDLLVGALVNKDADTAYDLNLDDTIDNKDLVYLSARLLTDASSFSFYTEDGKRLETQKVEYTNKGIIEDKAFNGLSKIRVVVNDLNGDNQLEMSPAINIAQTEENKISEKSNLLSRLFFNKAYASDVHMYNEREYEKEELFKTFIRQATEYIRKQKVDKYLTSWNISYEVIDLIKDGDKISQLSGGLDSFKNRIDRMVEDELVREHFQYDMDVFKRISTKHSYLIMLGQKGASKEALTSHVTANRNSETKVIKGAYGNKKYKSLVNYATVYYTEKPAMAIEGTVTIEGWTNPSGKIKFSRLGPGFQHDDLVKEYDIQNGKFKTGNDLATGEYRVDFYVPGEKIMYTLFGDSKENTFIFIGNEKEPNKVQWNIKSGGITIYGLIEENGEPLEGAEVVLSPQYKKSGVKDTEKVYTDENGKYKIDNVPFGAYDVLVGEKGSSKDKKVKKQEVGAVDSKPDGDLERVFGYGLSQDQKDKKDSDDLQLEWEAEALGMTVEEYKKYKNSENQKSDFEDANEDSNTSDSIEEGQSSEDEEQVANMLEELMKSLLSWFANWDEKEIEVPKIQYNSTYDVELVWKIEDAFSVTSRWQDISLTESSKIVSEYNSAAYVISEKEDIQPEYFNVDIINSKMKAGGKVKYDSKDLTLGVYKIAQDMALSKEDIMNMESEEALEEFDMNILSSMMDNYNLNGEYKKDTIYIEIDLPWEFVWNESVEMGDFGMPYVAHLMIMPEDLKNETFSGYIPKSDFDKLIANDYKYAQYTREGSEGKVSYKLTIKVHQKQ